MSMVEELKEMIASADHVADTRADCDVARFLRDHGQALVEALEDKERGDWMLKNCAWLRNKYNSTLEIALPRDADLSSYGSRRDAIDIARAKASSGGGA